MKKIITIAVLLAAAFGIWRYISIKSQQPSIIKEAKDTLQQTADYVPDAIDRKNAMENNTDNSVAKENERLQKALDEAK